jgi:carbon-monoxide dehydrogenase medium subunit
VLTAIRVPVPRSGARFGFAELARRHGDYALVGLAAAATADGSRLAGVRLAFFGVGDRPTRARRAEAALEGGDLDAAVAALQHDLSPHTDVHASAATRRHLAGVLLRRVATQLDAPT